MAGRGREEGGRRRLEAGSEGGSSVREGGGGGRGGRGGRSDLAPGRAVPCMPQG